jgi:hypothetical protein
MEMLMTPTTAAAEEVVAVVEVVAAEEVIAVVAVGAAEEGVAVVEVEAAHEVVAVVEVGAAAGGAAAQRRCVRTMSDFERRQHAYRLPD